MYVGDAGLPCKKERVMACTSTVRGRLMVRSDGWSAVCSTTYGLATSQCTYSTVHQFVRTYRTYKIIASVID